MTDQQLDELFKNRLTDHRSSVPGDMWERILRKKKDDRKGFLFFFKLFGLFVLGFVFAGFLFISINRKTEIQKKRADPFIQTSPSVNKLKTDSGYIQLSKATMPDKANQRSAISTLNWHGIQVNDVRKNESKNTAQYATIPFTGGKGSTQTNISNEETEHLTDSFNYSQKDSLNKTTGLKAGPPVPYDSTGTNKTPKQTRKDSATKRKWFLDVYASPDYPINSDPGEQMKLSYTIGLRIDYLLGKHVSIKSGIQFSQINLSFTDSNRFTTSGHLKTWDVPVLAGYSFGSASLKMKVNGGIIFNLSSRYTGDPDLYFKTNTGLSLYLGMNFEKQIHPRFSVFGEPYYRYRLTPMTIESVSTNKFIDVTGLTIGLRYSLNK